MTLRESKQLIRRWISERFSDERLVEVYAFNQDGRMRFLDPCGCLLGVTGSEKVHEGLGYVKGGSCNHLHYLRVRDFDNDGHIAENAYNALGYVSLPENDRRPGDEWRRIRLSAILRAQMRIRARTRQQEAEPVAVR
jgi:hypothetical protein